MTFKYKSEKTKVPASLAEHKKHERGHARIACRGPDDGGGEGERGAEANQGAASQPRLRVELDPCSSMTVKCVCHYIGKLYHF